MLKISIKSGLITLLCFLIYGVLNYLYLYKITGISSLEYVIFAAGIYSSHYFYKQEYDTLSFKEGIKLGMGVTFTFSSIVCLLSFIYIKTMNPESIDKIFDTLRSGLISKGYSEKEIGRILDVIPNIELYILSAFIGISIAGLIISTLISFFTKKSEPVD